MDKDIEFILVTPVDWTDRQTYARDSVIAPSNLHDVRDVHELPEVVDFVHL